MPLDSSMIFTAYRSFLSLALHPGDMMARGLLSMLYIEEKGCFLHEMPDLCGERGIDFSKWLERISGNIRDSIAANGFHAFLEHFIKVFEPLISGSDAKRLALALTRQMHSMQQANLKSGISCIRSTARREIPPPSAKLFSL